MNEYREDVLPVQKTGGVQKICGTLRSMEVERGKWEERESRLVDQLDTCMANKPMWVVIHVVVV